MKGIEVFLECDGMFVWYQDLINHMVEAFINEPNVYDGISANKIDYILYWIYQQHRFLGTITK